ncbi:MAG: hypothetical protein PHQ43_02700 [Dehalococcoidales bacterium]|nr:hypothetical protein [Dehalococcoidales bacterium]
MSDKAKQTKNTPTNEVSEAKAPGKKVKRQSVVVKVEPIGLGCRVD